MAGRITFFNSIGSVVGGHVVIGDTVQQRGSAATFKADGSITFKDSNGETVTCGSDECVLYVGGDVFRMHGTVTAHCAGPLTVSGNGVVVTAPAATSVTANGKGANVTATGTGCSVVCNAAASVSATGTGCSIVKS